MGIMDSKAKNIFKRIGTYCLRAILMMFSGALFEIGTSIIVKELLNKASQYSEIISTAITAAFISVIIIVQCVVAGKVRPRKHLDNDLGPIFTAIAACITSLSDNFFGELYASSSTLCGFVCIVFGIVCVVINNTIVDQCYEKTATYKYMWSLHGNYSYVEVRQRDMIKTGIHSAILLLIIIVSCIVTLYFGVFN